MKAQPLQDYGAACFFRRQEGSKPPFCSIQSRPSQYEITPQICAQCPIPAKPCKYLDARVLIAPGIDGKLIPKVVAAKCRKQWIEVNTATFEQCRGCPDYEVARQNPVDRFVDDLTGLFRREYFDATLEEEVRRSRSEGTALALLLADIDHFKRVNDTYGHLQGDRVLREIGEIAQTMGGERGVACRYGGEEIALILPRLEKKDAQSCGEELRRTVELHVFERADRKGEALAMTLSVGISLFPALARDPVELIRQADQALYRAKETGRNRVTLYDPKKDTEEAPKILAVTFHGFPEISNSGKISLEQWKLKEAGILEELVALDVFDHQRGVRSISEESKPGESGTFTQPIEGTAKEIVRQGNLTRFRLALRPKAFQDLERTVRRTEKKRKQDSSLSSD